MSSSSSSLNLKCHSCGSKITPENPCVWLGKPTYCVLCWYFTERPKVIKQMQKEGKADKDGRVISK
jgi:hypothetical protein